MKAKRHAEILSIIQEYDIETQDQLLDKLREKGMKSTQATISRDIKELHLVKELTGQGTYRYAVSERKSSLNVAGRLNNIFRESVTTFGHPHHAHHQGCRGFVPVHCEDVG